MMRTSIFSVLARYVFRFPIPPRLISDVSIPCVETSTVQNTILGVSVPRDDGTLAVSLLTSHYLVIRESTGFGNWI